MSIDSLSWRNTSAWLCFLWVSIASASVKIISTEDIAGGTVLLGSDDLLSAFACGCAFAWEYVFLLAIHLFVRESPANEPAGISTSKQRMPCSPTLSICSSTALHSSISEPYSHFPHSTTITSAWTGGGWYACRFAFSSREDYRQFWRCTSSYRISRRSGRRVSLDGSVSILGG